MDVHPLQAEAIALADSVHPRVVAAAFEKHTYKCNRCQYRPGGDSFSGVLHTYVVWKIRYLRLQNRGAYDSHRPRWGGYEHVYTQLMQASDALDKVWPCEECFRRFNPTHRTRRKNGYRKRKCGCG